MDQDSRDRFTNTVDDYRRFRPDYPQVAFDWLLKTLELDPGDAVIDIGCGTSISSRALAALGLKVVGVEPNAAMLAAAKAAGGGPRYVQTDAEQLDVPDDDYAAIVGAQSFHWIDMAKARPTFRRRLKRPGVSVAALWNLRTLDSPLMSAYDALLRKWSTEYATVGAENRVDAIEADVDGVTASFPHAQTLDREGLAGRIWSSSYIKNVVTDRKGFDADVDALFEAHSTQGHIELRYRTLIVAFAP
ncbi:MAG: class I SAM-dependent methyltransferase [Myxococcota bacterium]